MAAPFLRMAGMRDGAQPPVSRPRMMGRVGLQGPGRRRSGPGRLRIPAVCDGVRRRPPTPAPKWHPKRHPAENWLGRASLFGLQAIANYNKNGAGEGIRTLDPNLGKVVLYP